MNSIFKKQFFHLYNVVLFSGLVLISACENSNPDIKKIPSGDKKIESAVAAFSADSGLINSLKFNIFDLSEDSSSYKNIFFTDHYSNDSLSIFCFRGNHYRNKPSRGFMNAAPQKIKKLWEFKTDYDQTDTKYGVWGGGAGWTGQASAINWTAEQKTKLGIKDESFLRNEKAFEIIIGSLCGDIYFINAENGKETRKNLTIKNPIKGSVSVDPRKNGLLYVGQGIPHKGRFGAYVFDMFSGKEIYHISGNDKVSKRRWGAFDSNPLVDKNTGNVFWPAENGLIFNFILDNKNKPEKLRKMRYEHKELFRPGIESSLAIIGHYGYFLDNSGSLLCVELNSLKPVWNISNFDDSDATTMVDNEKNEHFLYVGHEVDKLAPVHDVYFRKIAARNGKEIWRISRKCYGGKIKDKTIDGGILASPVLGKKKGNNLVYCVFSRTDKKDRGEIVAINKLTGKEVWSMTLNMFSWSSPVDFYDKEGNIYLFFTDVSGIIYVVDGISGELIIKQKTEYNFEASPIMIDDKVFITSRGRSVLCYQLLPD